MPTARPHCATDFSLAAARHIVRDCFGVRPWIYWLDFGLTYGLGVFCFQQVRGGNLMTPHQGWTGEWSQVAFFVASCLLFYRSAMFIHELVRQRNGSLPVFRFLWNLICGIPFLVPTFVYYTHIDHHRRAHYGTQRDGEYLPLVHRRPWYILFYLSWSFVIPILAVIRFMVFTPLGWIRPGFRRWMHQRASSMVMDPSYIRPLPGPETLRVIRWQELGCFLWCWGVALVPPLVLKRWPIPFVIHAYLTALVIVSLNALRTLGSHRWRNAGGEMTFLEQLLDSVNYPYRPWITELWGPIGTRYHALHHLFSSMPYHQMPRAHRLLMRDLPPDSPYRETVAVSLWSVIRSLFTESAKRAADDRPSRDRKEGDASVARRFVPPGVADEPPPVCSHTHVDPNALGTDRVQ